MAKLNLKMASLKITTIFDKLEITFVIKFSVKANLYKTPLPY
jgi:hypothetical protein